jgi:hypothetical protein
MDFMLGGNALSSVTDSIAGGVVDLADVAISGLNPLGTDLGGQIIGELGDMLPNISAG